MTYFKKIQFRLTFHIDLHGCPQESPLEISGLARDFAEHVFSAQTFQRQITFGHLQTRYLFHCGPSFGLFVDAFVVPVPSYSGPRLACDI